MRSCILSVALLIGSTVAAVEPHPNLEAGKAAAARSGKPIFVLTAWKPGV